MELVKLLVYLLPLPIIGQGAHLYVTKVYAADAALPFVRFATWIFIATQCVAYVLLLASVGRLVWVAFPAVLAVEYFVFYVVLQRRGVVPGGKRRG